MADETSGRDPSGKWARNLKIAQRDADAAALRASGWTYQRIANELGYANRSAAYKGVQQAFADLLSEDARIAKRMDYERIDRLIEMAFEVMHREHLAISNGRVVRQCTGPQIGEDGEPVIGDDGKPVLNYTDVLDDGPMLQAMDRVTRLMERRARMYGYDEPTRSRVEVMTPESVESEIARLEAEIAISGERGTA